MLSYISLSLVFSTNVVCVKPQQKYGNIKKQTIVYQLTNWCHHISSFLYLYCAYTLFRRTFIDHKQYNTLSFFGVDHCTQTHNSCDIFGAQHCTRLIPCHSIQAENRKTNWFIFMVKKIDEKVINALSNVCFMRKLQSSLYHTTVVGERLVDI